MISQKAQRQRKPSKNKAIQFKIFAPSGEMQVFTVLMVEYDFVRPSDKALSSCSFRSKSVRGYVNLQKRYWQKVPRPRDHPHT